MAKLPINFQKIKTNDYSGKEIIQYLVTILEKESYFNKTAICNRTELLKLKDDLDKILADSNIADIIGISEDKAAIINKAYQSDILCKNCNLKMTGECVTCLFVLESPLERKLFLELKRAGINFQPQYGLNRLGVNISVEGKSYSNPENNFKDLLTKVDFYIEKNDIKLCVYTDGHTYHERTEDQAQRDRNIDRTLQEFGFQVLRYTGKDVKEDTLKIINDIKKRIDKK